MIQDPVYTLSHYRCGVSNTIVICDYSAIMGGTLNVTCGKHSAIGGGCCNQLNAYGKGANSACSVIFGGNNNKMCNTLASFIGGGGGLAKFIGTTNNYIKAGAYSVIGAGQRNCLDAIEYGFIGGGQYNCIVSGGGTQGFQVIVGGRCNAIVGTGTIGSVIGGGQTNTVNGSCYAFIGGGFTNLVQSANFSAIGGGYSNTVKNPESIIFGGYRNCIYDAYTGTNQKGNVILGGTLLIIQDGSYNAIGGGNGNKIRRNDGAVTCCNVIVGGGSNELGKLGLSNNMIGNVIGGGRRNTMIGTVNYYYNTIAGGDLNDFPSQTCYSFSVGGYNIHGAYSNTATVGYGLTVTATDTFYVNNLCQVAGGLSDCRIKKNILDTCIGLKEISQLEPKIFCFRKDPNKRRFGFLAQDIQQTIPCLICCINNHRWYDNSEVFDHTCKLGDPILKFDHDAIYVSLINAFRELYSCIDVQQKRLDHIRSQKSIQ